MPSILMLPESGLSSIVIKSTKVDFPAPEDPTKAIVSLALIFKDKLEITDSLFFSYLK